MGRKGDKLTGQSSSFVEELVPRLSGLGDVTVRKMFGGYGVFGDGKMFGLVTSGAEFFLKADESNLARYEKAGSPRHGKMPYYQVPETVLRDDAQLAQWARLSIRISKG